MKIYVIKDQNDPQVVKLCSKDRKQGITVWAIVPTDAIYEWFGSGRDIFAELRDAPAGAEFLLTSVTEDLQEA